MKGINNFFKTCPLLRLTCFIIACAAWQSVSAVDYDFGEMQLDVDYQLKNYKSHAGTFVVPEDGILVMTSDNGGWMEATMKNLMKPSSHIYILTLIMVRLGHIM